MAITAWWLQSERVEDGRCRFLLMLPRGTRLPLEVSLATIPAQPIISLGRAKRVSEPTSATMVAAVMRVTPHNAWSASIVGLHRRRGSRYRGISAPQAAA